MAEKMFRFDSVSSTWIEVVNVTRFDVPPPIIEGGEELVVDFEDDYFVYIPSDFIFLGV